MQKIVAFIPAWLTDGLNLGSKFLTAYGIALLLSTMLNRDLTVYFLLGFFFVGIWVWISPLWRSSPQFWL